MIASVFPPIIIRNTDRPTGAPNAHNNAWRIWIWRNVQPFAAVLAQERYEWGERWRRGLFLSLRDRREIELMGHAIEACVAHRFYGFDIDDYEIAESASLNLYPIFHDFRPQQRLEMLQARRAKAVKWVDRHRAFIAWARRIETRISK